MVRGPYGRPSARANTALQFRLDGDAEVVNARPVQINEYMAGSQSSLAVEAAWDLYPMLRKASGRVPLMRVALVEKVATELRTFLVRISCYVRVHR